MTAYIVHILRGWYYGFRRISKLLNEISVSQFYKLYICIEKLADRYFGQYVW